MTHLRFRAYCVLLSTALLFCELALADVSGRLFFTPAERTQLNATRHTQRTLPTSLPNARSLRLDGLVCSTSGGQTTWVNGQARFTRNVHASKQGASLETPTACEGPTVNNAAHALTVGQRAGTDTGVIHDLIPRNSLRIVKQNNPP